MLLFAFDVETSGLDVVNARVLEVGGILWSTGQQKCLESVGFLVQTDAVISQEITDLTGITKSAVDKFGYQSEDALDSVLDLMAQADAVVGHNVNRFDKRVLTTWAKLHGRQVPDKLWIDTTTDIPGVELGKLTYVAADHQFLNLFPHSALSDCQTVIKLISMYDIDSIVARAKQPNVILKAHVTFDTNKLAKKRKYRWYGETRLWWKLLKESDVDEEVKSAPFDVSIVKDVPEETLLNS